MRFQEGLVETMVGAIMGLILNSVVMSFARDGSLPSYVVPILYMFNIVAGIAGVIRMRAFGFLYVIGWIIGSFIVKDIMEPLDIVINIVLPIIILIIGIVLSIRRAAERY